MLSLTWPGRFNHTRTRLECVRDRETQEIKPYPRAEHFAILAAERRCSADEAERQWRRDHILVVPEWGGVSVMGGDWSYSRAAIERWLISLTGIGDELPAGSSGGK